MTDRNDAASGPDPEDAQDRIRQLAAEREAFLAEKQARFAEEQELRRREDPAARVSFAAEIFELQQEQRRLDVEMQVVDTRIRRLELGYPEEADPACAPPEGFAF